MISMYMPLGLFILLKCVSKQFRSRYFHKNCYKHCDYSIWSRIEYKRYYRQFATFHLPSAKYASLQQRLRKALQSGQSQARILDTWYFKRVYKCETRLGWRTGMMVADYKELALSKSRKATKSPPHQLLSLYFSFCRVYRH